jgi:uncharacterized membrane protein required for colicin V production
MPISWFDLVLIIILASFVFNGLSKGLIRLFGRILGLLVGAIIASHFYIPFYYWSQNFFTIAEGFGKVLSFIILFVVATRIIDWIFVWIEKFFNLISIIPFTKIINRLLGGVLGFLEGALFLGVIIYVISQYSWLNGLLGAQLETSLIASYLLWFIQLILPILPEAIKTVKSIMVSE